MLDAQHLALLYSNGMHQRHELGRLVPSQLVQRLDVPLRRHDDQARNRISNVLMGMKATGLDNGAAECWPLTKNNRAAQAA